MRHTGGFLALLIPVLASLSAAGPSNDTRPFADPRPARPTFQGNLRGAVDPLAEGFRPRGLASGDFNEDGVADLAIALASGRRGAIALVSGDPDALYPYQPGTRARRDPEDQVARQAAFFRPGGFLFDLPMAADFLGAGDFDNDGHPDLVAGAKGGRVLVLLKGDGAGGFARPVEQPLPGRLSHLLVGDVNHPDAIADIVAAVEKEGRTEVLVYEGAEGAWSAKPEVVRRGAPVTTLAIGDLDGDFNQDLTIGIERGLEVVRGRDRALSISAAARAAVAPPDVRRHRLDFTPLQASVGRFAGSRVPILALTGDDGTVRVAASGVLESPRIVHRGRVGRMLIGAALGDRPGETLLGVDGSEPSLRILDRGDDGAETGAALAAEPVAAVAMRLGPAARDSVVVLNDGGPDLLTILPPAAPITYTVTTIADGGAGSLRQAILDANAHAGLDTIAFAITPSSNLTITPATPLPDITDPVTVDATTQPGYAGTPIVELDGSGPLPPGTNGLVVRAGSSVVRGLVIRGFKGSGVALDGAGHSIVEGNFIGLDHTGTVAVGNQDSGVVIRDSHLNTIGGTAAPARNVISGNMQAGVAIRGPSVFEAEYVSQGAAVAICDLCTVSMPIAIPDERLIDDLNVRVSLSHTFDGDLVLTLIAPDNTRIVLSNRHGGGGDDYNGTIFDDGAATPIAAGIAPFSGTFVPDDSLSVLNGRSQAGTWRLEVQDMASGDTGSLNSWSMTTEGETIFGNVIEGNLIGTDLTGTVGLGNTKGVVIDQSSQNLVGGTAPGARNVIAGSREVVSGNGVEITGSPSRNAQHNTVLGNYIGIDITGTQRLPNQAHGVEIANADACLIGGTAAGARNVISANLGSAVHTQFSAFDRIQGNYLGTDVTGTVALSRQGLLARNGAVLDDGTTSTVVGGSVAAARNIASGSGYGIWLHGFSPTFYGNVVLGNYAGTDPTGTLSVANGAHGILVDGPNVQVGGPGPGEGNLASGNTFDPRSCGIAVWNGGTSCVVQGNVLGLDATGTVKLGNSRGLLINGGAYCRYGGANPGEPNIISGNVEHGVWIVEAAGNPPPVQSLSVDTPKGLPDIVTTTSIVQSPTTSTQLLVNLKVTVRLTHTFDSDLVLTLIAPNGTRILLANRRGGGGDDYFATQFDDGAATPISLGAPPFNGVFQPEEPLTALSGIPTAGTWTLEIADVAGGDTGFLFDWWIDLKYLNADKSIGAQLIGNFIGTTPSGASGLGNGAYGVWGEASSVLQIGVPGVGNVIAGNTGHGISLIADAAANVVQSNLIGLKPDGVTPLGNGGAGIVVSGPVGLIGGPGAAFGNHIAWNAGAGVDVSGSASLRQTTLRANSIHDNGGLGIDLAPVGVNPNDPGDGDSGANMGQNYPVITSVTPGFMNSVLVSGTLQSRPDSKYVIDVYGSPQADPSGYGEGRVWLGSGTFTTDSSGNVSWTVLTQNTNFGLIAATATDVAGNTSEFSGLQTTPQEASPAKNMTVAIGAGNILQISYTPACGATDHVLYWGSAGPGMIGPGGLTWTSAACGLGTSGAAGIPLGNPPVGQAFYFVMVGQNGSVEGSYGQASTGAEKPEATFPAICAKPQLLGGGCF